MSRTRGAMRVLLLGTLILSALIMPSARMAVAQSNDDIDPAMYESELSGWEIEVVDDDFEIYEAEIQNYSHGQGEIIQISSNTASIQVSFFDDTDSNLDTMEIYNDAFFADVDEFEILDQEDSGETVFTFAMATYNGVEFYYYLSVTEDVEDNVDLLQRIYATDATFFADVEQAQEAITIDRDGFMEDVDVDDLEDAAGARQEDPDEPTEESTEVPEEEPTAEPEGEPVPTIDASEATSYDFTVIDAQLLATDDIQVGQGEAEEPGFEFLPMRFGESDIIIRLDMRPESPEASLDMMLSLLAPDGGSLENIATDATRTEAWSLDVLESDGEQYFLYIHVQSDRFQGFHLTELLITPATDIVGTIEDIQRSIQINGVPMFGGAELETLDFVISGGEEDDAPAEDDVEDDKADTRGDSGEEPETLDLESQGLVSDSEFVSPQYELSVEWDQDAWVADPEWEMTAESNPETGIDSLILISQELDASVMLQILPSNESEPEDYINFWVSEEYMAEAVGDDAEVMLSDSSSWSGGVVYRFTDAEGDEVVIIKEMFFIDDIDIVVTVFSSPDAASDAYADVEDLVTVDGEDAAGAFTPREVERALD